MAQDHPTAFDNVATRKTIIRELNDTLRGNITQPGHNQIVMTAGVAALIGDVSLFRGFRKRAELLRLVRDFDTFEATTIHTVNTPSGSCRSRTRRSTGRSTITTVPSLSGPTILQIQP